MDRACPGGSTEAVWAVALGKSEGFSRPTPSLVLLVAIAASVGGLAYAMRVLPVLPVLPVGTAHAAWVGIGAALTVAHGTAAGDGSASLVKVLLM